MALTKKYQPMENIHRNFFYRQVNVKNKQIEQTARDAATKWRKRCTENKRKKKNIATN